MGRLKKKIAQFQNIFLRCPLCVNIYEHHFRKSGEEKKECPVCRTRVYRTANKERWINKMSSHSRHGQWGWVQKKISPFGVKKKKKCCCILLRPLSDGPSFIGWLLILDLILWESAYGTEIIERYFFLYATSATRRGGGESRDNDNSLLPPFFFICWVNSLIKINL